ncbi:flagellar motor protein MotB [Fredinandcohnia sp. QZ13]|uniref:flagellar motor protein MotB n=1 Tax=Fredinandcohnia sp. QZ13 TaxID=3073144 RepID=UPI002853033C|nr:flagellar motor protein MotB [Fredinandcohnia sp. QZ13]MDR4886912.1 flagellar motor protein MotB [Fredinandcohnia sp. QZ13]
MARKRRKAKHEEHMDESWLVPYADILTLLLALFIVLFAASNVDVQKFQKLASSFNNVFKGGTSFLEYESPVPVEIDNAEIVNEKEKEKQEQEELKELQKKINSYITENGLDLSLKTRLADEGLLVTIQDGAFFNPGSADVRPEDLNLAREISELLVMNPPRNIIVSGHTDTVPMNNHEFKSNWHLSVMRAVNFMSLLLENKKLDPRLFSARGLGEYEPVATNETPEGRKLNRRVEVLIQPNLDQQN